jgi:DnaJ-class molecular chaperone
MEYRDYYATLGVARDASAKEIKAAFRRLARRYHPDVSKETGAEKRFKEINEAYEVLGDPEKRRRYDELGANWKQYEQFQRAGAGAGGFPGFDFSQFAGGPQPGGGRVYTGPGGVRIETHTFGAGDLPFERMFGGGEGFSDFFQMFFSQAAAQSPAGGPGNGSRARTRADAQVEITLEEAFRGTVRTLEMREGDAAPRRIEVKVPAGVRDGAQLRLRGQGASGGDIHLRVRVLGDSRFKRRGDDLVTEVRVPKKVAEAGGQVTVTTISGRAELSVPAGTRNGSTLRLRGLGMPAGAGRGDLLATVRLS